MKTPGSHSVLFFFIFLIVGGILGGIVGEALYAVPALKGILQHYEILNIQNIHFNLYLMELQFGIHLAPNMLSIIGVILAAILFRHLQ